MTATFGVGGFGQQGQQNHHHNLHRGADNGMSDTAGATAVRGGPGGPSRSVLHEHIAASFKRFDEDDKGWLGRHDLKCAFASLAGYKPSALELQHITAKCPNGEVDLRQGMPYHNRCLVPAYLQLNFIIFEL